MFISFFFFSSRRRHTRCALVTGVQTCALPIYGGSPRPHRKARRASVAARPPDPRRTGLSAVRPRWRAVAVPSRQPTLRTHLGHRHHQPDVRRMADRVRRCQNDHRAARSAHPSLRHRRDRQRELAVQESKLSTVTTGAKGDVVLGYDGSGLRPPPSYPRTTMRWWSPFTCRSRSPLPRRLTNRTEEPTP